MTSPQDPPTPPGRWRRRITLLIFIVGLLVAGGWRYRITRPDYRLARGQDAIRAKDAAAVRSYADRLEASGHTDHAHLLRGEALLAFGVPDRALAQFNQIHDQGPLRLRAAALSGRCLLELGELKEAHRAFSFVVSEEPDHIDAHRGLGAIAYDLGRMGEAVDHLHRVGELDPSDPRPHRLVGLIYKDMAQLPAAEEAYREALRRGPPSEVEREVRAELAEVQTRQGKFTDGLATLDGGPPTGAVELPVATATRAECLRGLGRQDDAARVLDAALARAPTGALNRLRGQVYQDQGRLPEALRCYERAAEADPADHQAVYLLGQALAAAGRKADADRAFARAEQLRKDLERITALSHEAMASPWDAAVRLQLAESWDRLGKPQLAQIWRKAAAACSAAR